MSPHIFIFFVKNLYPVYTRIRDKKRRDKKFLYFFEQDVTEATSSLHRDFRIRRKQTELETFSGYIVKEAKRLGVSIPLSEKIYQGLMEMAEKF